MRSPIRPSLIIMISLLSVSCIPGPDSGEIYVVVEAQKSSQFNEYLAKLVRKHGLTPSLARATDDKGYTTHVLDAKGWRVRLWSQEYFLGGDEDPTVCGVYTEPHSDPGQYMISVSPRFLIIGSDAPRALLADIKRELKTDGFYVRSTPLICSPLSKKLSKKFTIIP